MSIFSLIARKFAWISICGFLTFMLVACSAGSGTQAGGTSSAAPTKKTPAGPAGQVTEFTIPVSDNSSQFSFPIAITSGPDGNLWFTEAGTSSDPSQQTSQSFIGRVTPAGKVTEFPLPTTNILPTGITKGPDGNLWFTESATISTASNQLAKIGYITPQGDFNEFLMPAAGINPLTITTGSDGNLWFTDSLMGKIGRMSTHGKLTEFPLPAAYSFLRGITSGPDGNLWFTEISSSGSTSVGKIGRITPTGSIQEFPLTEANSSPAMITSGPDGNLWFTETISNGPNISSKIGRITPTGVITIFSIPNAQGYSQGGGGYLYGIGFGPISIAKGPDGNLWFSGIFRKGMIGRITPAGIVSEFSLPNSEGISYGISSGPDGNLWFTASASSHSWIGRITSGQ
ncbi:MAG TPA: Virginiamycin B lyase [Ktedonobacteraceae bacterium]|nr:Virginiamycin B lyase [Ktedonobacteraceae bacterium]